MIWADRLAMLWCVIVAFVLLAMTGSETGEIERLAIPWFLMFCVPVWLLLRLLDWVAGGPSHRRSA